jgi:hypothetical protein
MYRAWGNEQCVKKIVVGKSEETTRELEGQYGSVS